MGQRQGKGLVDMTPQKYGTDHITAAFGIRICMVGKTRREEEEKKKGEEKKRP